MHGAKRIYLKSVNAGANLTTQNPSGLDVPMQIALQDVGSENDDAQIFADGRIKINVGGTYLLHLGVQYGRVGSGSSSILYGRILIDGTPFGVPNKAELNNSRIEIPTQTFTNLTYKAGQIITYEIWRDSSGANRGGLISTTPAIGGIPTASAFINISRYL